MPGHPIAAALEAEVKASYDTLKKLIDKADVIFLLMDSRESRWLPTVIAASKPDKILINAALGFDTYLVMRHGIRPAGYQSGPVQLNKEILPGKDLGCYYCNDVVAPGDSLSDRTLDMQCTVTRPGVSAIAAALAVELAVSCLQHPEKGGASCLMPSGKPQEDKPSGSDDSESVLGLIPHSIRGSVHTYNQYMPATPAFSQCTGCSKPVIEAYAKEGFELVKKVGEDSKYLEDLTGIFQFIYKTFFINF
jgi:ubiquitin-like modifier-activating enzyme ATG7